MSMAREIKAIIRESKLDEVLEELHKIIGSPGATVSLVRGFGKPSAHEAPRLDEAPMYKLEIVVSPEMAQPVLDTIARAAWTGQPGDGKVFVYEVSQVLNIRTKTEGTGAL